MTEKLKNIFICLGCLLLCACGAQRMPSMFNAEQPPVTAESQAAFSVILPADWQVYCDEETRFAATSPDGAAAMSITAEFGGFTFYSTQELGDKLLENSGFANVTIDTEAQSSSNKLFHRTLYFSNEEGREFVAESYIYNPYPSVVYYCLFDCNQEDYAEWSNIFSEIFASFRLTKSQNEIYQMIEDINNLTEPEA